MKKLTLILLLIGLLSGFAYASDEQNLIQVTKQAEMKAVHDDIVPKKDETVKLYKSIPDVVWAAVIASFLTLAGVTLSNRSNRKSLAIQLNHYAQEKEREREQQIRKEVYIEASEAIAEAIQDILFTPNRIINTDAKKLKFGDRLIQSIAKVHMVGTLETLKILNEFMGKFNMSTVPLSPYINKYACLKEELVLLKNITYETKRDNVDELILVKAGELESVHSNLNVKCINSSIYLQKESFLVLFAIRKELKLEIDTAEYLSKIEKMFKSQENFFNIEKIEELKTGSVNSVL